MYGILFLAMAMICHNPNHKMHKTNCPLIHVTTLDDDDSGDTGHIPPKPPTPPTPPTPPNNP